MKKRLFSVMMASLMMASMISGCGSSANKNVTTEPVDSKDSTTSTVSKENQIVDEDKTTLSLWCPFTGSDGDILKDIIKKYNETNSDNIEVDVDIMDNATLQSKLPTAIATGTGPSFILMGIEYINEYVANDCLDSINDFWNATGTNQDNYYENVVAKSYVGDDLYGIPMQYNLQYLYYNKDMFEKAGLDPDAPPTTMDELEQCAEALTDPSNGTYGLALPNDYGAYVQYLWGNGGDVVDTSTNENLLNSTENAETLKWLQDLYNEGVSPQGTSTAEMDSMFQAGQIAMEMNGPWNINALNSLGINYGITAIPTGSDGAYSAEGGCSYMIPKGTDDATKQAIYKFMAYWISDDVLKEWSTKNGFPVWSYSLLEDTDIKNNEILSDVSAASTIGRDWHLGYAYGSQIDNDVMKPMMEKIFAGNDVKETLKEASGTLDSILKAQ